MFGLLRVPKGYLTEEEFSFFQAHYCGLCHALNRNGNQVMRAVTSYDAAALAIFVSGLAGTRPNIMHKSCPFSPWRKKHQAIDQYEVFDFAAKTSLGLISLKAEDEITDSSGRLRHWLIKLLQKLVNSKAPGWGEFTATSQMQNKAEQNPSPWYDELAYPSGYLLGSIAARAAAVYQRDQSSAYAVGNNLGKWIYTWDALWDLEKDLKIGRFNAIASSFRAGKKYSDILDPELIGVIDFYLDRCLSKLTAALSSLDIGMQGDLLNKLVWGANRWHKGIFYNQYLMQEGTLYERYASSWQSGQCHKPQGASKRVGGTH